MGVGSISQSETRAQERRDLCEASKECEGPRRKIVDRWSVHLSGVHFNSGLQTYLTLIYSKKYIFIVLRKLT